MNYQSNSGSPILLLRYRSNGEKTISQKVAEADELKEIEAIKAKERMKRKPESAVPGKVQQPSEKKRKTDDIVAKQSGLGSATTYDKAKHIVDKAKAGQFFGVILSRWVWY